MADIDDADNQRLDPYAALRFEDYRFFMVGWFLAMIGTRIQSVAIGWEMYSRTGDALSLGLVGLAQALPTMLLALPAGYLADRMSRPLLIKLSLAAMTVTSLSLALLSYREGSVQLMYLFLFMDAAAVIIGRPARSAIVPHLVPKEVFPNAVTWNTTMMNIAAVTGPAIGGVVVAFSVPSAYVLAALSSIIFIILLSFMKLPTVAPARTSGTTSLRGFLAGISFVWNTKIILTMITLDLFAVLFGGAVYLLPIYAQDILNVGATGFGWLRAAPAVGAMCMALSMVYLPPMQRAGRTLLINVALFGVATIFFGISRNFWFSFAMLFFTGAFDNVSMVIRGTLQQLITPDHMRGRVSAVTSVFVGASNELGGLESGLMAHWFGPVFSVVFGGIGTLTVVALAGLASPELRRFGPLTSAKTAEWDEDTPLRRSRTPVPAQTADAMSTDD
ncbi:MAG: MFS transporter [Caldilineaceae bacterium]